MSEQELKALRLRIDSLDEKVLELISERARCAQEVARVKMGSLAEGEVPVFWACGVTPQAVAMNTKPELMITHAPGYMFICDTTDESYGVI